MAHHTESLRGCRVAILVTDGFEQVELTEPLRALQEAGAEATIIAPGGGELRAWQHTDWGDRFQADLSLEQARPADFDGLLLPGGVLSPDRLRMDERAVAFVQAIGAAGKPIAAICHGPWTLINAGLVAGRELTSYPSLRADLENARARWIDREVVTDGRLVTSRSPDDLPAFNQAMLIAFGESSRGAGQVSEAPNTSFESGAGQEAIGGDPAALAGNALGNQAYPDGNRYPDDG